MQLVWVIITIIILYVIKYISVGLFLQINKTNSSLSGIVIMTVILYRVKWFKLVFVITREKKLSCQYILNNLIVKVNGYYAVKHAKVQNVHGLHTSI